MSTEKFTRQEFEAVSTKVLAEYDCQLTCKGFVVGEYRYWSDVKKFSRGNVRVEIASSIGADGLAEDTGENSIRVYLTGDDGLPLGNKIQKWVTRVSGWETRYSVILAKMVEMGQSIEWCKKCNTLEKIFITKKEGPNKGRLFIKCNCPNSFEWLDESDDADKHPEPKAEAAKNVKCPKCGGTMRINTRRSDGVKFWSCNLYPACKGTLNVAPDGEVYSGWEKTGGSSPAAEVANTVHAQAELKVERIVTNRTWTEEQENVFTWAKHIPGGQHLVVEARAGAGKSSTAVQMMNYVSKALDVVFCTFNSHNAEDLQKQVPAPFKASTTHSLAWGECRKEWGNVELDEDKTVNIISTLLDRNVHGHLFSTIANLVSLVKGYMIDPTVATELDWLVDHHSIVLNGDRDVIFEAVIKTLAISVTMTGVFDFDDMLYMPVYHKLNVHTYDMVVVDEAQDTNKCQLVFIKMITKPTGRIVAIGDRYQSMYGFRGADAQAIPNIIKELSAGILPLTVGFRNPKLVVDLVNKRFPHIAYRAREDAPDGVIREISEEEADSEYKPGDMILCRTNAPLVKPAFALIRRGVKAVILGREIGSGLVAMIRRIKAGSVIDLISRLTDYAGMEVAKLEVAKKNSQAQALKDKVETIIALADGANTISDIEFKIKTIFSKKSEGVVFSSIHKAKGKEAKKVFILHPELLPHPMAKQDWEKEQEVNIEYVALTRTQFELVFVQSAK